MTLSTAVALLLLCLGLLLYYQRRKKLNRQLLEIGKDISYFVLSLKICKAYYAHECFCLSSLLYCKTQNPHVAGTSRLNYVDNHLHRSRSKDIELPLFDLYTISKATDNFSINNKLGEGGFGPVYKVIITSIFTRIMKPKIKKTEVESRFLFACLFRQRNNYYMYMKA